MVKLHYSIVAVSSFVNPRSPCVCSMSVLLERDWTVRKNLFFYIAPTFPFSASRHIMIAKMMPGAVI